MASTSRKSPHNVTTKRPGKTADERAARSLALTILHHPEMRRVGEVAILPELTEGQSFRLSRVEPGFAPPGRVSDEPLEDAHVSRKPVELGAAGGGGVTLTVPPGVIVEVDGEKATGSRPVAGDAIDRGVVLMLAQTLVLVLHRVRPPVLPSSMKFVGASDAIESVRAAIRRVADLEVPVLIRGETGTGKELVARAIAEASPRAGRPYLALNMAALTPSTAAAELFGYARGAFTGAVESHEGYFGEADSGTLFLDEIGLVPSDVQAMLLRALETGEIQPLGTRKRRRVDVRFIAASDTDLEQAVAQQRFSGALLHRLAGFEIRIPPLRERREDMGRLLVHFLGEELRAIGEEHRLDPPADGASAWLPASFVARLALHSWPGNVRELRNVARQVAIASRGEPRARVESVLKRLEAKSADGLGSAMSRPGASPPNSPAKVVRLLSAIADDDLVEALRRNGWRPSSTAADLGISRTSLYVLIDRSPRIRKAASIPEPELRRVQDECAGDLDEMSRRLEVSRRGLQLRLKGMPRS